MTHSDVILTSRSRLPRPIISDALRTVEAAEGGCGVLGFTANIAISGRHVLSASRQMHNRGNGKGGGIAMAGLVPEQVGVDAVTLRSHYMLQIALLDPNARQEVEEKFINPYFTVAKAYELPHIPDFRSIPDLEVCPPDVWRYFVRVRPEVLAEFAREHSLAALTPRQLEDEFVYQNSYRLNVQYYASLGDKRAFVLSHGRNLSVLKIVGYAEDVVAYYQLEDQAAHVWIAHQRYPTKGRVWHPGGAHPFIGMNEALVHNGDFANYHAVGEYLRQRNINQLFLTDTEVSVQLFDLWDRVYGYPLEITLEAMAPTSEYDFEMLSPERQALYRDVQRTHIHGSPDGPWFFIVARSIVNDDSEDATEDRFELLGITDTSMLRPQVFALYENLTPPATCPDQSPVQIGLIASERQAINACLRSLSEEDPRFQPLADRYWAARGGSHTDGGAFRFSFTPSQGLSVSNKFGQAVTVERTRQHVDRRFLDETNADCEFINLLELHACKAFDNGGPTSLWKWLGPGLAAMGWEQVACALSWLRRFGESDPAAWNFALEGHHLLRDRLVDTGMKKRSSLTGLVDTSLTTLFGALPGLEASSSPTGAYRLSWDRHELLRAPGRNETALVVDGKGFPPEGDTCVARVLVDAARLGWKRLLAYNLSGGRFAASGLGEDAQGLHIDLYGDVGDYCGSGLDGAEVTIHGDGQDQLGQIMRRGRLVIHGDVGQTFLYGAKGGEIFVRGSAAGRPLINAVGRPRVVINGTCLDYLAESFMAGDPLSGGGFVVVNGITNDDQGFLHELESPYPGGNLFSLASGGAIYLRDPHKRVNESQLNGGVFQTLTEKDWILIEHFLLENERLFGIQLVDLLTVAGVLRKPEEVYRKVSVPGVASGQKKELSVSAPLGGGNS